MHYEIKKIDWLTAGIFSGFFSALVSLVPMFFGVLAFIARISRYGFNAGILAFLFFPIGAFIGGFAAGSLFALIYNIVVANWQGLKIDIVYSQSTERENNHKDNKPVV